MPFNHYRTEPKYKELDDRPGSTHSLVLDLVEPGARVLEFGCATGYMSQALRDRHGATVIGVERDATAAQEAESRCQRVLVGDIEELDLESELGGERFDVLLFADVLEHLRDPAAVLRRFRPLVADDGAVVASIPNVAHASVRLALLAGSFEYREKGLLDESHFRFFTREGIRDLFESCGYVVTHWARRRIDVSDAEIPVPPSLPRAAIAWVAADAEATTYQFIVRAVPADEAHQLQSLRTELDEARSEIESLRPLADEREALRPELAELDELRPVRGPCEELGELDAHTRSSSADSSPSGQPLRRASPPLSGACSGRDPGATRRHYGRHCAD